MFSLRTHLIICVALFAAVAGLAMAGNLLASIGVPPPRGGVRVVAAVVFFGLFIAFGFSAIPVIVKLVIGAQRQIGNENVSLIQAAASHETAIILGLWGIIALGLVIAIPAAVSQGFFGSGAAAGLDGAIDRALAGSPQGILSARPGMTFEEVVKMSTLPIDIDTRKPITAAVGGGAVFDFEIPGTGIRFEHCRYYFLTPATDDRSRIESISIGTSSGKMSRAGLDAADHSLRVRLAADGWLTGHEEYRTEEDRTLHGGLTRGTDGRLWLKGDLTLSIDRNRMDEEVSGEDAATAGKWIQYVNLWPKSGYPYIDRFVFAPWDDSRP